MMDTAGEYQDLLDELPTTQRPQIRTFLNFHGVTHTIPTRGPPVSAKQCRLCPERLVCAKAKFDKLLADGIVRKSDSA